jgi:hypothetical protein
MKLFGTKMNWLVDIPAFIDRLRIFPRMFMIVYMWMLYEMTLWFLALPDPTVAQAGFVSVVVGAGAAWFGIYVNSSGDAPRVNLDPYLRDTLERQRENNTYYYNEENRDSNYERLRYSPREYSKDNNDEAKG